MLDRMLILHLHAFYHFWLACHFIVCLDFFLWRRMAVNLCAARKNSYASYYCAEHEVWVACSAQNIARLQHTKSMARPLVL